MAFYITPHGRGAFKINGRGLVCSKEQAIAAAERETAETGRTCTVFEVRIIHNTTAPKEKPTCTA